MRSLMLLAFVAAVSATRFECYADIAFVYETTEIMGPDNFGNIKNNIEGIASDLQSSNLLGYQKDKVGTAHFAGTGASPDGTARSGISLPMDFNSYMSIQDDLNNTTWGYSHGVTGGMTNLSLALELTKQMFDTSAHPRNQTPHFRFLVFYTRGERDAGPDPVAAAVALRNSGVIMIGVEAGSPYSVNDSAMNTIIGNRSLVFKPQDAGGSMTWTSIKNAVFDTISHIMKSQQCGPIPATTPTALSPPTTSTKTNHCALDVVFILDRSESVGVVNGNMVKQFVRNITQGLVSKNSDPIGLGPNSLRVGIVDFATQAHVDLFLNASTSITAVFNALEAVDFTIAGLTNLQAGLSTAAVVLSPGAGDRAGNPDVAILISDGVPTPDAPDWHNAALKLRSKANILAIGVEGSNGDVTQSLHNLANITGDPKKVFNDSNYNDLYKFTDAIVNGVCPGPVPITTTRAPPPSTTTPKRSCYADVAFVVETTVAMGDINLMHMQAWIVYITQRLQMGVGQGYFGLADFSNIGRQEIVAKMRPYTKLEIVAKVSSINYVHDVGITDLTQCYLSFRALRQALTLYKTAEKRNQLPRFPVLILMMRARCDVPFLDSPTCYFTANILANQLRREYNAAIWVVLRGQLASPFEAVAIAGDARRVIDGRAANFNPSSLLRIVNAINENLDKATCQP